MISDTKLKIMTVENAGTMQLFLESSPKSYEYAKNCLDSSYAQKATAMVFLFQPQHHVFDM